MKPGKKNDARHYQKQSTLKVSFSVQTQISFFERPCEFLHLQNVHANTLGFSLGDFTT